MSRWDKIYCELCQTILDEGIEVKNRTGINTVKIPSAHFQLDVDKEFPILTTKQLFIRQAILEMLWIYQAQSNDYPSDSIPIPASVFPENILMISDDILTSILVLFLLRIFL